MWTSCFFNQLLQYIISDRAKSCVLQCQFFSFYNYIFISIRKAPAIGWALIIDAAKIVLPKEWTRPGVGNKVAVFIYFKKPFYKYAFLHFHVPRNSFYIRGLKTWGIIFAAIGALEAVYLWKGFVVELLQLAKHFVLICPVQVLLIKLLAFTGLFFPIPEVRVHGTK